MKGLLALLILSLVFLASGCSKEKMDQLVDSATNVASDVSEGVTNATSDAVAQAQTVVETAADVTQVADMTGSAKIKLDTPTDFAASYIRLVAVNEGRPAVLQIKSNKDGDTETFPSFLIQANVQAADLNALAGQTIPARLFAQKEKDGVIWFSEDGKNIPVNLAMAEGRFTAKIDGAMVMNTATMQASPLSGTFECATLE